MTTPAAPAMAVTTSAVRTQHDVYADQVPLTFEHADQPPGPLYRLDQELAAPLAGVGLVLNLATLIVWQADPLFHSTVFVLKCLALWDALFCGLAVIWLLMPLRYHLHLLDFSEQSVWHVGNVCQTLTVYVTLLLVFVQVCAGRPRSSSPSSQARRGCGLTPWCCGSAQRLVVANVTAVVWGGLLESLEVLLVSRLHTRGFNAQLFYLRRFFALWLPLLPLLLGLLLLAWPLCRREDTSSSTTPTSPSPAPPSPAPPDSVSDPPVSTVREPLRVSRRLTPVVLGVGGYTALAYSAWFVVKTLQLTSSPPRPGELLMFYVWLCVLLKSSVSPLVCLALSPAFRHLLHSRLACLGPGLFRRCQGGRGCPCCPATGDVSVGDVPLMEMQEG